MAISEPMSVVCGRCRERFEARRSSCPHCGTFARDGRPA